MRDERCFICDEMKTLAWEAAFHIPLRNYSREVGGKVSIHMIFVNGEVHATKHIFFFFQNVAACLMKLTASHEKPMSPLMILVLF